MRWSSVLIVVVGCWTGPAPAPVAPAQHAKKHVVITELPAPPEPPQGDPELGRVLYASKGCILCHTTDGTARVGPSWRAIWDSDVVLADRRIIRVDSRYVRRSLADPQADLVLGFPPVMPSFAGLLSNTEIEGLIAFIATLQ